MLKIFHPPGPRIRVINIQSNKPTIESRPIIPIRMHNDRMTSFRLPPTMKDTIILVVCKKWIHIQCAWHEEERREDRVLCTLNCPAQMSCTTDTTATFIRHGFGTQKEMPWHLFFYYDGLSRIQMRFLSLLIFIELFRGQQNKERLFVSWILTINTTLTFLVILTTTLLPSSYNNYLNRCGETARVFGGCHNQGIHMWLSEVLKVQFLGQFDNSRCWPDVKCSRSLALCLQRVSYFTVRKWFRLHGNYAKRETQKVRKFTRTH